VRDEAKLLKRHLRARFEEWQGPIRNSYFCRHLPGAIAMIEDPVALHTVLNSDNDRLVALEADCHALTHQVQNAFTEPASRQALIDGIYSAMTRVLAAADVDQADLAPALAAAEAEVDHMRTRVRVAIQRQARFVYFQGTLFGTLAAIIVCVVLGMVGSRYWANHLDTAALVIAALFGALGAVVSVFQRISTGKLTLDFNAARWQLLSLGSLRPLVGSIFGAVAQFALGAGLFGTGDRPATALGVFALIGFAAGFSERFATDMVERAGQVLASTR
jgi:hypothetical protein